jgi:hypothetical protein
MHVQGLCGAISTHRCRVESIDLGVGFINPFSWFMSKMNVTCDLNEKPFNISSLPLVSLINHTGLFPFLDRTLQKPVLLFVKRLIISPC